MTKIEKLSDVCYIIDDELFYRMEFFDLKCCPTCYGEIMWDTKEGFYSRPGCLKCDRWFGKVVAKDD